MAAPSGVYALYVEKELIGKRVKGTKVRVIWKFACQPELKTHEVELKHSLVSGKREIKLDGRSVFASKKFFSGPFSHVFRGEGDLASRELIVKIDDGFEGYVYDLVIDGRLFHRNTRISILELEEIRKNLKKPKERSNSKDIQEIEYDRFTKRQPTSLDGRTKIEDPTRSESKSLEKEVVVEDLLDTTGWSTQDTKYNASKSSDLNALDDLFTGNHPVNPVYRDSYSGAQKFNEYSPYEMGNWNGFDQGQNTVPNQANKFDTRSPYSSADALTNNFDGFGFENMNTRQNHAYTFSGSGSARPLPVEQSGTPKANVNTNNDPFSTLVNLQNLRQPAVSGTSKELNTYGGLYGAAGTQQPGGYIGQDPAFRPQSRSVSYTPSNNNGFSNTMDNSLNGNWNVGNNVSGDTNGVYGSTGPQYSQRAMSQHNPFV